MIWPYSLLPFQFFLNLLQVFSNQTLSLSFHSFINVLFLEEKNGERTPLPRAPQPFVGIILQLQWGYTFLWRIQSKPPTPSPARFGLSSLLYTTESSIIISEYYHTIIEIVFSCFIVCSKRDGTTSVFFTFSTCCSVPN